MIILDTNVLSALMPPNPAAAVVHWLDQYPADSFWITSITHFEIEFGIALLAAGRRRNELQSAFERLIAEQLEDRVLDFDRMAASAAARLAARRQRAGKSTDIRDTQIAGIAVARRATLATRNVRHFEGLELGVVNPWG
jgi:predicted nucleic acid-binding protein